MEMQYFIRPEMQEEVYESWRKFAWEFLTQTLGIKPESLQWHEHEESERAHYAAAAHDIYFNFPQGFKELWGTHNRTDFDLSAHAKHSGVDLSYLDEDSKERFIPYVIESSVGVGRMFLAVLADAYTEDEMNGEVRTYLKFHPRVAPIKAAVFPLLKNKPELVAKAREIYENLKKEIPQIMWDDNGNVGKRYRRQDEIGTPFCVTVDFDTLGEKPELLDTVTLRDRDTGEQQRVAIQELSGLLTNAKR
jgi:glycyl-tRNA synthetase